MGTTGTGRRPTTSVRTNQRLPSPAGDQRLPRRAAPAPGKRRGSHAHLYHLVGPTRIQSVTSPETNTRRLSSQRYRTAARRAFSDVRLMRLNRRWPWLAGQHGVEVSAAVGVAGGNRRAGERSATFRFPGGTGVSLAAVPGGRGGRYRIARRCVRGRPDTRCPGQHPGAGSRGRAGPQSAGRRPRQGAAGPRPSPVRRCPGPPGIVSSSRCDRRFLSGPACPWADRRGACRSGAVTSSRSAI
jgi:hypothetical protein